jgi:hypothetical protein
MHNMTRCIEHDALGWIKYTLTCLWGGKKQKTNLQVICYQKTQSSINLNKWMTVQIFIDNVKLIFIQAITKLIHNFIFSCLITIKKTYNLRNNNWLIKKENAEQIFP